MKIFSFILKHFHFFIFFLQIKKISSLLNCTKNCIKCETKNECLKCKGDFELIDKRCYRTNCQVFGYCKYCDEYDCLQCQTGYKLNYGICDKKVISKKILFVKIIVPIMILILIVYWYLYRRKKAKEKIETGQVIKFRHPKSGFYHMNYEKYYPSSPTEENVSNSSQNKSLSSRVSDPGETPSAEVNLCVVCGSKKTYGIADCGCSLCFEDFKMIRGDKEKIKCRIHNIFLSSSITFEMYKSNIKGNAVERLGLSKCPICKINDGTQGFNCGCPMKVCEKCFNDNVYVLKYNQCPGCGMPYVPLNIAKKRKKSKENKESKESKEDNVNIKKEK